MTVWQASEPAPAPLGMTKSGAGGARFGFARPLCGLLLVATAAAAPWALAAAQSTTPCGELRNAFGPFDYRTERGPNLAIVENAHFTASIDALTYSPFYDVGGHIDYTLRAFPNHHRALLTMTRLAERLATDKPRGANYTVSCYYDRAVRSAPDDTIARMLFARYLAKAGKKDEARFHLATAERMAGDNPFTHYNLGLVYLEMADYANALRQEHLARALGFSRDDLRDALVKAGKWVDPPATAASDAATGPVKP